MSGPEPKPVVQVAAVETLDAPTAKSDIAPGKPRYTDVGCGDIRPGYRPEARAFRSVVDTQTSPSHGAQRHSNRLSVVRFGVQSPTTVQR
ncbi:MAG: hypothetical protein ACLP1D_02750 [Xanthobacteraceae bacterium]